MSENAINAFGLMVREGPCYHCGIDYTPLWRCGPPEKPVLCNACGSRWRTRRTLKDYIPKHANKDYYFSKENQSNDELPPVLINPTNSSSILNLEEEPPKSSLSNSVGDVHQSPEHILERVFSNVARKKRSKLGQYVLSPTERFHQQLCHALEDLEVAKGLNDEAVLIFEQFNHYILGNEIGLGCILLKPHDVSPTMINNTKPKFSTIDVKSAPSPLKGSISDQSSAC